MVKLHACTRQANADTDRFEAQSTEDLLRGTRGGRRPVDVQGIEDLLLEARVRHRLVGASLSAS